MQYTFNEIAQWVLLGIILVIVAIWIVRRIRRKDDSGCGCGCNGCTLADKCRDKDKPTRT